MNYKRQFSGKAHSGGAPQAVALLACLLCGSAFLAQATPAQTTTGGVTVREVTFPSDTITLAADLAIPEGAGPFPIVIWVHGSGKSPRSNPVAQAYGEELLERGIAFLNPDKRGSGKSGGDWTVATFDELAADASAAVAFVSGLPEIDQERITLLGFSQGSHIVSLAGSNPAVDRVISLSGSVVPLSEQIRDEVRMMAGDEGLTAAAMKQVDSLNSLAFAYARDRTPDAWSAYAGSRQELATSPFGSSETVSGFPTDSSDAKFRFLGTVGTFDPLEHWPEVTVPVLFMFGGRDHNVDSGKSLDLLASRFAPVNQRYVAMIFGPHSHAFIREDQMDFVRRWIIEDE